MILRPMDMKELLSHIPQLLKGQLKSYLGLIALGIVSALGLTLIISFLYFLFGMAIVSLNLNRLVTLFIGISLFLPFIPLHFIINAAFIKMTSEQILDRKISSMEAYRFGFKKFWCLLFGGTLYSIIILIGTVLLIIPGVYLGNAYILFLHSIVIEDKGPWSALKRSKALTKGSWWRCLGIMLLLGTSVGITSSINKFAIDTLSLLTTNLTTSTFIASIISSIVSIIFVVLLTTLIMITTTLLYYDLSIRNENLNLQVIADNITEKTI